MSQHGLPQTDVRTPIATNGGDQLSRFADIWKSQIAALEERFPGVIVKKLWPGEDCTDIPVLYVKPEMIVQFLDHLKETDGFEYRFLADLTATDESPAAERFEMVYMLFSHKKFNRIRVKCRLKEGQKISTIVSLWPAANWAEREVYDMFGIEFSGHPDLRRILMDMRWVGHPLRKDYPLKGYQIFPTPEPVNPDLLK